MDFATLGQHCDIPITRDRRHTLRPGHPSSSAGMRILGEVHRSGGASETARRDQQLLPARQTYTGGKTVAEWLGPPKTPKKSPWR
jgi:hypothetical protein